MLKIIINCRGELPWDQLKKQIEQGKVVEAHYIYAQ